MPTRNTLLKILSALMAAAMLLPGLQSFPAQAQGGDGLRRHVNAVSGRVSFIGPEKGRSLPAARALGTSARPDDPALALARRYGPEFGLGNAERSLSKMESHHSDDGQITVRFQQVHDSIPVMGGELIVRTDGDGNLYSMNGEVSPDLALSTQAEIGPGEARETALGAAAKWYHRTPADFTATEPELWIFDESLLRPSTRPAELVWRMEVTARDNGLPVRELVLVDAGRGQISLHFNQVDTASASGTGKQPSPTLGSKFGADLVREAAFAGAAWYVSTAGNDENSCSSIAAPCKTINAAIGKAQAGDTIKITTGTYTGAGAEVVLIGKSLTLSGGWDAGFTTRVGRSTIDGQGVRRGVMVTEGTVSIDRLIIKNGYHDIQGGGLHNGYNAILTLTESIITGNVSHWMGGGIYNTGSLTLNDTAVSSNSAGQSGNSGGGGGGGIENASGSLMLNKSTVSGNKIEGSFQGSGIEGGGVVAINNSTISGNTGSYGIYISLGQNTLSLNNSTITDNPVGGLRLLAGRLTLQNTLLAKNGSLWGDCSLSSDYGGTIVSLGHNLIGRNQECPIQPAEGDLIGTSEDPIEPRLGALQNNGGYTLTHALISTSPAVDAGDPATCLTTDQRGVARPVDASCDIGAYEGNVPWVFSPQVKTYTANNSANLPGTLLCDQTDPGCSAGDAEAKAAHKFAIGTASLYATKHARDSIDNNGMAIISSVHYCPSYSECPYDNANWTGSQMVYGSAHGYALADDIVAHELTHGVTQYESNLFYYYQSGAINESFSDLWGEYYDQVGNPTAGDTAGTKWLLGEDVPGLGALRSMSNPPLYKDPDRMTSPYYYTGWGDNYGVHWNSGVNNKAVYLMVDGGWFNGRFVAGLGWDKVGAIYYEAGINLLTSGADYSDLYYALQQACTSLVGHKGITAGDCASVKNALDAVEMNAQPFAGYNPEAPLCTTPGDLPDTLLADGLEAGTGNWVFYNGLYPRWQIDSSYFGPFARSGRHSLYADDYPDMVTDARAQLASVTLPANAYLHFAHAYEFEYDSYENYDGGVLEYSTNGGASWADAGWLIDYNSYNGTLASAYSNPLGGRMAFVGSSHGYISTRLNLAPLVGQVVSFRWRMGLDEGWANMGWWVDDVRIYTCAPLPVISGNAGASGVTLSYTDGGAKTVTSQPDGSYSITVPRGWSGTITPSHACFTSSPAARSYSNVRADQPGQNYSATLVPGCAGINVLIGTSLKGRNGVPVQGSLRQSYAGTDSGPVKVYSTNNIQIIASERINLKKGGSFSSYSEVMGLPASKLSDTYIFPWYNNTGLLDSQLRFGNMGDEITTVTIKIGGVTQPTTYTLEPNQSTRVSFAGMDNGPVEVTSSNGVPIIAALRINLRSNAAFSSYSEFLGMSAGATPSTRYLFPWYNNTGLLDSQLRFGNVGNETTTVTIKIGGVTQPTTYTLAPSESTRISYSELDNGPVEVASSNGVPIIAAMRINLESNTAFSSYTELMGLPGAALTDTRYLFPWYNNTGLLDSQLRFGNVGNETTTVTVKIGGVVRGSYVLDPNASMRVSVPGVDSGPVEVTSSNGVPIIAALRINLKSNTAFSSYYEFMGSSVGAPLGLPGSQLSTTYWFPWYNNTGLLDSQLRFGVP